MLVTLADVAKTLGLSPGLVSRVLNGDPRVRASKATQERIHQTAREMQYRPSPSARALASGQSRQIAISCADSGLQHYLSSRLLEQQGLIQAVTEQGYSVVLLPPISPVDQATASDFKRILYTSGCDGVCVYAEQANAEVYAGLRELGLPFVVLGDPGDTSVPQVDHDNYLYAYESVAWLHALGHTRIGFTDFLQAELRPFAHRLHQGYRDAVETLCGGFDPQLVIPSGLEHSERLAFLRQANPPTALLVRDWKAAMSWRVLFQELGVRIPEDIVVLVHLALTEAYYLEPGFAFQAHDPRAVGRRAGQVLLNRIKSDPQEAPEIVRLSTLLPQWQRDWFTEAYCGD